MNLRTLKKLSKRAAPLLPILGDHRGQFPAERDDNYASVLMERKHWRRSRCHPTYKGRNSWSTPSGAEIVFTTRAGNKVVMQNPPHPRKGTVMVGAMSGYYEPEWDEETAWEALHCLVADHFTDWGEDYARLNRQLDTPSQVFRAADEMITELNSSEERPLGSSERQRAEGKEARDEP